MFQCFFQDGPFGGCLRTLVIGRSRRRPSVHPSMSFLKGQPIQPIIVVHGAAEVGGNVILAIIPHLALVVGIIIIVFVAFLSKDGLDAAQAGIVLHGRPRQMFGRPTDGRRSFVSKGMEVRRLETGKQGAFQCFQTAATVDVDVEAARTSRGLGHQGTVIRGRIVLEKHEPNRGIGFHQVLERTRGGLGNPQSIVVFAIVGFVLVHTGKHGGQ